MTRFVLLNQRLSVLNHYKAWKSGRGEVFSFGRGYFCMSPITFSLFLGFVGSVSYLTFRRGCSWLC